MTAGDEAGGGRAFRAGMDTNMTPTAPQKQGKSLRLENGGSKQRRHHELPDQWLDREMRSAFAALYLGADNVDVSRGIYNAAEGYTTPWRPIARRIREAERCRMDREKVKEIGRKLFDQYVDRVYDAKKA